MLKTTIKVKNEKRELTNLELQKMQDNALDHGIVSNRIRDNWTEEEVFNVPKGMSRTQYAEYKSLKNLEIANKNDKSDAIMTKILKKQLRTSIIKICGVNTDACVMETVRSLSEKLPECDIQVIKNACNSLSMYNHNYGLNEMALLNNVIIQ